MTSQATRLLDAQTVLVGWINHSATDCYAHVRSSGDVVNLGTDFDACSSFALVASHSGHGEAAGPRHRLSRHPGGDDRGAHLPLSGLTQGHGPAAAAAADRTVPRLLPCAPHRSWRRQ
jgi:hypothetical protein